MNLVGSFKRFYIGFDSRTGNINRNTIFMLVLRGINILISFLYVPLLINSLSSYHYGIWLTITSIIAWLTLMDIGLGNGLRNRLTESLANNDVSESRNLIGTAYASISVLSLILIIAYGIISSFLNWSTILNIPQDMRKEVTALINIVFVFFSVQFVLSLINSVLFAFQKPAFSTLIITLGQLISFLLVAVSVYFFHEKSLYLLGLIISVSPVIVLIIFSVAFFSGKNKIYAPRFKNIKVAYLKRILGLGINFFILQIITVILFQTANIIIAQKIGQVAVTEYNVAYKYLGLMFFIFSIVVTPYWSATTDAYAKKDFTWIINAKKKLSRIWGYLSLLGALMLLFAGIAYKLWLGDSVKPDYLTLGLALIYFVLFCRYILHAYMLNGIGAVRIQMIITSVEAVLFIPGAIMLAKLWGLNGVFIALILTALINTIWSTIQFNKIVKQNAQGIWIK